jgi:hypothetical protein
MGQIWNEQPCPYCGTVNWIYMWRPYDPDPSKMDPEPIYKCYSCLKNFIDDEMDFEDQGDPTIFEYGDLWESVNHDVDKFIEQFEEPELGRKSPGHG